MEKKVSHAEISAALKRAGVANASARRLIREADLALFKIRVRKAVRAKLAVKKTFKK